MYDRRFVFNEESTFARLEVAGELQDVRGLRGELTLKPHVLCKTFCEGSGIGRAYVGGCRD